MIEFGMVLEPSPGYTARLAREVEAMGFDVTLCPDTQNLSADVYVQLALAAAGTTRLRIGPGVTHPITRDVAVAASALATLQAESAGRIICGAGRGDSSAAHIGRRNATTAELRQFIERLKAYLSGAAVDRDGKPSRLRWLDSVRISPVPIDVACTGPKTIRMAVEVADRISFAVGSAPERIAWAIGTALDHLRAIGRPRESLRIGAYVNLVCDRDTGRAVALARTISGMVAHFAGMPNAPLDHLPPRLRAVAERMQAGYDMARHAQGSGSHLAAVSDEFVEWFSICGPPELCRERLGALIDLGLEHVYLLGGSPVEHPHGERQAALVAQTRLFAEEVLPALAPGARVPADAAASPPPILTVHLPAMDCP